MFKKETKIQNFKDAETVIGSTIKIKGNFHGKGDIVVEGLIEGSLKTDANIYISEKANVSANVTAGDLIINGRVEGDIKALNFVKLGASAQIVGNISCQEISIEKGARVNGQISCSSSDLGKQKVVKEKEQSNTN